MRCRASVDQCPCKRERNHGGPHECSCEFGIYWGAGKRTPKPSRRGASAGQCILRLENTCLGCEHDKEQTKRTPKPRRKR